MFDKRKMFLSFIVSFLLAFMTLIFGPAEIFFANVTEFDFLYGEFAGNMALIFIGILFVCTVLLSILPQKVYSMVISTLFTVSIVGYLQVMFLNKNLDLLGVKPDGYRVPPVQGIINLVIWLIVLSGVIVLAIKKSEIWKKVVLYLSLLLVGMQ